MDAGETLDQRVRLLEEKFIRKGMEPYDAWLKAMQIVVRACQWEMKKPDRSSNQ